MTQLDAAVTEDMNSATEFRCPISLHFAGKNRLDEVGIEDRAASIEVSEGMIHGSVHTGPLTIAGSNSANSTQAARRSAMTGRCFRPST